MSTKSEFAKSQLAGGFGCAASVLSTFCEDYDLDTEKAVMLACGLGGGCASGEICGAISGAVLVIGLKYGMKSLEDTEAKAKCHERVVQFIKDFKEKNKSITCNGLLECDTTTDEGFAVYLEKRGTVCPAFVKDSVEILEELGY